MKRILILMGKSGSGKDSIAKEILRQSGYRRLKECTTRPMREGESEENPYHFITEDETEEMIGRTVFHTVYGDWCYGFVKEELNPEVNYIAVANPAQVQEIWAAYGRMFRIIIAHIVTDEEERILHVIGRQENTPESCMEICRRIETDHFDFSLDNPVFRKALETAYGSRRFRNDYVMPPEKIAEEILEWYPDF